MSDISQALRAVELECELRREQLRAQSLEAEVAALRKRVLTLTEENTEKDGVLTRVQANLDSVEDLHGDMFTRLETLLITYESVKVPSLSDPTFEPPNSVLNSIDGYGFGGLDSSEEVNSVGPLWGSIVQTNASVSFVRPRRRQRAPYMAAAQRSLDAAVPLSLSLLEEGGERNTFLAHCDKDSNAAKTAEEMDEYLENGELDDEVVFTVEELVPRNAAENDPPPHELNPTPEPMKNTAGPSDNCVYEEESYEEWREKTLPRIEKRKQEIRGLLKKLGCHQL